MEDNGGRMVFTVGTVLEIDDSAIEWTLKDVRRFFQFEEYDIVLRSPKFQLIGATWNLDLYYDFSGNENYVICSLRRHQHGIRPSSITCQVVVKRKESILVEHLRKISPNETQTSGYIATLNEFYPKYNNVKFGDVKVFCTFYQEVEVPTIEEFSEDFKEHGKQKAEGLDILSSHMKNLYLNRRNCDFVIRVKDKEFQVHKAILCARSPVLAAMLQHEMEEKNSNTVEIVDCEPDIFEQFLLYLYTGRLEELSWENALPLYVLGDKYDVEHLRRVCAAHYMEGNLCVEAFCDAFRLGLRQDCTPLIKNAEAFFLENAAKILVTPKWQLLMEEHPVTCNELFIQYVGEKNKV